jgi:hypothetical protein
MCGFVHRRQSSASWTAVAAILATELEHHFADLDECRIHWTRGLSEWVPKLRVEIIPGAGHWVPYERPDVVNSLIREYVDQ